MTATSISSEESVHMINEYCKVNHGGSLCCVVDPIKGRTLHAAADFDVGTLILKEAPLHAVRLDPENPLCGKLEVLSRKEKFTFAPIW